MIRFLRISWLLCLPVLLAGAGDVCATDVEYSAQLRTRTEFDTKDFTSDTAAKLFTLQRARFGARFKSENVSVFLQLQDARTWGTETNTLKDASADQFDLHQGYFEVSELFGAPLSLRAGRMELVYGNQRLVGAVGWSNTGRSFDGAVLKIKQERLSVDLWAANVRDSSTLRSPGAKDTDRYFFGAYANIDWEQGDNHSEVFVMFDLDRDTIPAGPDISDNKLQRATLGATHRMGYQGFETTLEGALQLGTTTMMPDTVLISGDISAYFFAVNLGYGFSDVTWSPWFGAGLDWLSGDDDPTDNDFGAFNTLFATNHKWYGYMDYFPSNLGTLGLKDFILKARVNPVADVQVAVNYHKFERGEDDAAGLSSFGQEIDTQLRYKHNSQFTVQAGYSIFVRDDVVKATGGKDDSHWFYLMAIANL